MVCLYQIALIMTHRDRPYSPLGRKERAGDAGYRQTFLTPSSGLYGQPKRRFSRAFGQRRARFPMPRIATAHAPCRKPWKTVSMGHY